MSEQLQILRLEMMLAGDPARYEIHHALSELPELCFPDDVGEVLGKLLSEVLGEELKDAPAATSMIVSK